MRCEATRKSQIGQAHLHIGSGCSLGVPSCSSGQGWHHASCTGHGNSLGKEMHGCMLVSKAGTGSPIRACAARPRSQACAQLQGRAPPSRRPRDITRGEQTEGPKPSTLCAMHFHVGQRSQGTKSQNAHSILPQAIQIPKRTMRLMSQMLHPGGLP